MFLAFTFIIDLNFLLSPGQKKLNTGVNML